MERAVSPSGENKVNMCSFVIKILIAINATSLVSVTTAHGRVKRQQGTISLGPFTKIFAHGCNAKEIKILDEVTLEIGDMEYRGDGPDAWFVVGNSSNYAQERADMRPVIITIQDGAGCRKPGKYERKTVTLKLPRGNKIQQFTWFMLYCIKYHHNFCYVTIPDGVQPIPGESSLDECPYGNGVSGVTQGTSTVKMVSWALNILGTWILRVLSIEVSLPLELK